MIARIWPEFFATNEVIGRLEGDWERARDFSNQGLSVAPRDANLVAYRLNLEYQTGNLNDGKDRLEQLLELMRLATPGPNQEHAAPSWALALADHITNSSNWIVETEAAVEAVMSYPYAIPAYVVLARVGAALLAILEKDVVAANEQYRALRPYRGTVVLTGAILVDRLLALLAQMQGDVDDAVAHFEDAVDFAVRQATIRSWLGPCATTPNC